MVQDFFAALASESLVGRDGAVAGGLAEKLPAFFRQQGRRPCSDAEVPATARAVDPVRTSGVCGARVERDIALNCSPLQVLVDTEPRVVGEVRGRRKAPLHAGTWWQYPDGSGVLEDCWSRSQPGASGSGNNWAMGYHQQGAAMREAVLELVRAEAERSDRMAAFQIVHSLAGGTGSGLGSRVSDELREAYPQCFQLHAVVWPYSSGEVVLQNYNAVLSLARLADCSDAIINLRNEEAHDICTTMLDIPRPGMPDLNRVLAGSLAALFLPAGEHPRWGAPAGAPASLAVADIAQCLCASPAHKMLSLRTIPQVSERARAFSADRWHALAKHLAQMLAADHHMQEGIDWAAAPGAQNRSLANLLTLRGPGWDEVDLAAFQDPRHFAPWSASLFARGSSTPLAAADKSIQLLSNSQAPVKLLDR